jgi:hypothetical protein
MSDDSAVAAAPHYRAFISYSHADGRFAGWLHRRLEAARLPDKARLTPIFFDRAELAAGPDLSAQVREALAQSAALIVIASPAARASRWVGQEIALFRVLHPDRPVLAALIKSEPAEAFPEALLSHAGAAIEPLAADFRKGQDGKRLGLLKIVAGLTAQPLDRLVQRDAQTRQRRVMAVTAGALLLSLILSAALVLAIRARAEAERQRGEAEGLVEFMLTDLRDKLKGVGRLDVMDAVNQRAMAYYGGQSELDRLSPDSLQRRARVIEAMGEDDEHYGRAEPALAKYRELYRVTAAQLAVDPSNPDRILAHAISENRLGLTLSTMKRDKEALPRLRASQNLLKLLPIDRSKPKVIRLRSLVSGNLCAIAVEDQQLSATAVRDCEDAVNQARLHLQIVPGDLTPKYDLAFHLLWLGDAQQAAGLTSLAEQSRMAALATSQELTQHDPANMMWREQHMEISFKLAWLAKKSGNRGAFKRNFATAQSDHTILVNRDPNNKYWALYTTRLIQLEREAFP